MIEKGCGTFWISLGTIVDTASSGQIDTVKYTWAVSDFKCQSKIE